MLCDPRALHTTVAVEHCHAAVVMSHHLPSDAQYLRELAQTPAPAFVGLLGPDSRRSRLLEELGPAAEKLKFQASRPRGLRYRRGDAGGHRARHRHPDSCVAGWARRRGDLTFGCAMRAMTRSWRRDKECLLIVVCVDFGRRGVSA